MEKITPKDLNKILSQANRGSRLRSGSKEPYQVLREDFYELIRRRKLGLDECALAIYLRGKACQYSNPFRLANKTIYHELGTTRRIIDPLKHKLQIKGVIKYNSGLGTGNWTIYTMLDSVMVHKRDKKLSTGYPQRVPNGTL